MKKYISFILIAFILFTCACAPKVEQATLPVHRYMEKTADIPKEANELTKAYILATDTAINIVADKYFLRKPEFISFLITAKFPLNQSGIDYLIGAFDVYGIDVNTKASYNEGFTFEEKQNGFIIEYYDEAVLHNEESDYSITVMVNFSNKGYAYYFDFKIVNGKYILYNYEDAFVNVIT